MNHNILHTKSLNKYCPLALMVVLFVFTGCKTCDCPSYTNLQSNTYMLYNIIASNILSAGVFNNEKSYQQRKETAQNFNELSSIQ